MSGFGHDSLNVSKALNSKGKEYHYFSLAEAEKQLGSIERLPFSLKVLLENLLRFEDGKTVSKDDVKAVVDWQEKCTSDREIAFRPARVLMQDFTGVPAVVDLASMRDAIVNLGGKADQINPLSPVDLVIDHSVMVDSFANENAYRKNVEFEYERNRERYAFLRWGQQSFNDFRVVPPGTGICHQVNLEYLGKVAWTKKVDGKDYVYPDTLVGTDSHTTMINGLGILGWGVGGIEAEAAMLGQPISMVIPEVVGFKISGQMKEGTTATDIVLTVTQMLREKGVVGKFVEFFGPGLDHMSLADRATLANMAPEYGATCGIFPVDKETIRYMKFTGRSDETVQLAEDYAKAQGYWRDENSVDPVFTDTLQLDLGDVEPSLAGPKRPQDKVALSKMVESALESIAKEKKSGESSSKVSYDGHNFDLEDGDVVIAAITSCTNTSNPSVMLGAGLLARKALEKGLMRKPWVKTSLAPGSKVVTDYLDHAGLTDDLNKLGFNLVGYGCTTCIGNSGPLPDEISKAVEENDLAVAGVLSGNRNFEGRIHQQVKLNYLASPLLVVAYALAGSLKVDLYNDPLGKGSDGQDVYLKDIWPSNEEIEACVQQNLTPAMFQERYADVFTGDDLWHGLSDSKSVTYGWEDSSTYVKHPPFFANMNQNPDDQADIHGARVLALLGDSVTTDHISPAGAIAPDSPAGKYLEEKGIPRNQFNSYGSRRGNHEVMMRGTFANIRLRNEMVPAKPGGYTKYIPNEKVMSIYDAAMKYQDEGTPLVIFAGKEYGTGSSRDWAAKGTRLLGVKAVVAESFERIHRSNLIGMGVLPLMFKDGQNRLKLRMDGYETVSITGLEGKELKPGMDVECTITFVDGRVEKIPLLVRLDTADEVEYYQNGGILHYVLRRLIKAA